MLKVYLDNNATTALDPRVADVMLTQFLDGPTNASSQHAFGRRSRSHLDTALETIGSYLGTKLDQPNGARLIITSGGTESNHQALTGLNDQGSLVLSQIEHPSVLATVKWLEKRGRTLRWLETDPAGLVRLDQLETLVSADEHDIALVSLMAANNETGVIQPISQAAEICQKAGILLHVDATQTVGKLPLNLEDSGISALTFTAHKFHGPAGVGGLWLAPEVKVEPVFHGGEQQLETRPGTEPVALVVGMAEALKLAMDELQHSTEHCGMLRDRLETGLLARHPELVVQGKIHARLPGTSSISFLKTDRQSMLMALDMAGIACSSGAACSSGSSPPSHVLMAMHRPADEIESTLRFGVSKFSTIEEIDVAIESISITYNKLRTKTCVDN